MRKILISMCMLALCAVSPLVYAAGNEHGQVNKAAEPQKEPTQSAPHTQKDMMSSMMEMMQKCKAMMSSEKFSSMSIISRTKDLGLTDEQVKELKEIDKESAAKAKAVLKPDQVTKMEALAGQQKMMCPMMNMMNKNGDSKDKTPGIPMKEMKGDKKDPGMKMKDTNSDDKPSSQEGMKMGK